jgi:hypothetical protein
MHERRTAAPKALAPPRGDGAQRQGGTMSAHGRSEALIPERNARRVIQ